MRIPARNGEIPMPQIIPHLYHIHPSGQPATGGGMPEQVRPHLRFLNGGPGEEGADLVVEDHRLHGRALIRHQQMVARLGQAATNLEPGAQGCRVLWRKSDQTFFVALTGDAQVSLKIALGIRHP